MTARPTTHHAIDHQRAQHSPDDAPPRSIPPFARLPVTVIMGITGTILLLRADRYDYFGDELYFLAAGRRPSLAYPDQGALVPLLARLSDTLAPGSLVALRLPAILVSVLAIAVTAALAREFGGGRDAQVLAALAYATCPFLLSQAASLSTFAFDATLSAALVWLLVRWIRTRRDRLLLSAGVLVAVDLQVKWLVLVLLAGLAAGIVVTGPRTVLRRPLLWVAVAGVAISATPGLLWQARHGWPQLAMGGVIRDEQGSATGGAAGLLPQHALLLGAFGALLFCCGAWFLVRHSTLRPYRLLAVALAVQIAFILTTGSRPYYLAAFFPAVIAVGAVGFFARTRSRWPTLVASAGIALATAIAVGAVLALPVAVTEPTTTSGQLFTRLRLNGTTGWEHLRDAAEEAYQSVDSAQRARTVIVTSTYWQAGALDYSPGRDLPAVYSPNRGFAPFGPPPETSTTVLYVAPTTAEITLRRFFSDVEPLVRFDDPLGFPGIDRGVTVWRCDNRRRSWAESWPALTTLVVDKHL
ncbi:glycosyltransferase family 39 protein [Nocardia sp. NPDC127579]|uniref:glycosyltransferase family 39 protein n=1 Tax=Nocardia sp. NPDC127579 TaxID=3345402 RepID=UPI00363B347A